MPSSRRSRRRPWSDEHVPLDVDRATGGRRSESGPDGDWTVQRTRGSEKAYSCPGCRQTIPPRTTHVVAWASDGIFGAESALADRRHWHTACWEARGRRR
ncbi:hypothetical protein GCM10025865_22790 [Paraoerskovia sediminicola]|uniref:DUF8106 domain-containing protein n=1 Tax=Paraoerskovia sediminicola TaxID=1138587 RepID=A0ABN6XDY7_9CELL|nr:hypothetical protein [Paraoerskovia sediminicola]BDZ42980.1 hypothetical protein GCM10025865_22790 [Paraoerskovia sediminicola]